MGCFGGSALTPQPRMNKGFVSILYKKIDTFLRPKFSICYSKRSIKNQTKTLNPHHSRPDFYKNTARLLTIAATILLLSSSTNTSIISTHNNGFAENKSFFLENSFNSSIVGNLSISSNVFAILFPLLYFILQLYTTHCTIKRTLKNQLSGKIG